MANILDQLDNPDATTLSRIVSYATGDFESWPRDPHRLETCGYVPVRNDAAEDGPWRINAKRQAIYAKSALPLADQLRAAKRLTDED